MKLLQKAENKMAYLKMGLFGGAGSGKTFTASEVAIGLHKQLKSTKPVAFFDTETGSSFMIQKFKKSGIDLFTFAGTSLKSLTQVIDEAEKECSILIIDSITNVWDEFTDSYMKKKRVGYIELWDWKPIKKEWREEFRNRYLNSNLHIILCGREGHMYETTEVKKNGRIKKETVKAGTKMRAEGDTGYEPSLLCEMEKIYKDGTGKYVRQCTVIKDRFDIIDSKSFDNPKFKDFLPHIENLNIGGEHLGIDTSEATSEEFFNNGGDGNYYQKKKEREIILEELKDEILLIYPSTSTSDKANKVKILKALFGTSSWTSIEKDTPIETIKDVVTKFKGKKINFQDIEEN